MFVVRERNQVPENIVLFIISGVGGGVVSYITPTRQVTSSPGSVSSRVSWERVQPSELGYYLTFYFVSEYQDDDEVQLPVGCVHLADLLPAGSSR